MKYQVLGDSRNLCKFLSHHGDASIFDHIAKEAYKFPTLPKLHSCISILLFEEDKERILRLTRHHERS